MESIGQLTSDMRKQKGAVAAGHPLSAETAEAILRDGGNAFDAAVGAQFTALVAEPVLTSLGGGGFLFAEKDTGKQRPTASAPTADSRVPRKARQN